MVLKCWFESLVMLTKKVTPNGCTGLLTQYEANWTRLTLLQGWLMPSTGKKITILAVDSVVGFVIHWLTGLIN